MMLRDTDSTLPTPTQPPAARPRAGRLRRLHARLRGRYRFALFAALAVAAVAAIAAWRLDRPTYRAAARIDLTADAAHLPALIEQQVRLARAQDNAFDRTTVEPFGGASRISVDDADPAIAAAAAASIARRLVTAHADARLADLNAITDAQHARNDQLERAKRLDDQRRQLLAAAGPVPIEQAVQSKLRHLDEITAAITAAELSLSRATADETAAPAPPVEPRDLTADGLDRLAVTDRKLASLLLTRRDIERRIADAADRFGEAAPAMIRLRSDLAAVRRQIDQRLADTGADAFGPLGASDSPRFTGPSAAVLRARVDALRTMQQAARSDLSVLADTRSTLDRLDADLADARARIDRSQRRVDTLAADAASRGTLAVAEPPSQAAVFRDRRPAAAAIAGSLGFAAAYAIALLLLIADRRILRPADAVADGSSAPLLGSVPTITPDQRDPRDADLTALSIHQIRALLEVRARARGEHAFAITSPSKGSGKTSLTVGLASSLALSGTRTLLVDCSLGSRLAANESDDAPSADQSLDEVMVQMGYLDPREADLFVFQDNASIGLLGMLAGRSLEQCAVRSSIPGLSILPALAADAHDIGKMSGKFIRRIIDESRDDYDMILFDTGPIPGSIEAMLVAGTADGVVVVASRGEDQHRYNRTIAYLDMVGAKLAGTVFNRADRRDLNLTGGADADDRRNRKAKPQPLPFGAKATRRLPPPPGMGSGILAAAVHAQAQSSTRPAQAGPEAAAAEGPASAPARPAPKPQPHANPAPPSSRAQTPQEISVADAGDIASILDEAATIAEASSDRDMTDEALEKLLSTKTETAQRAAHATPVGKDGRPIRVADELDADDHLGSAIDQLLSDAGAPSPRAPQIHVDPTEPTRRRG